MTALRSSRASEVVRHLSPGDVATIAEADTHDREDVLGYVLAEAEHFAEVEEIRRHLARAVERVSTSAAYRLALVREARALTHSHTPKEIP